MNSPDWKDQMKRARAQRLVQLRLRAGFLKRPEAVKFLKVSYNTYSHHENGNRLIEDEVGHFYASKFKGNYVWLMHGIGKIDTPNRPNGNNTVAGSNYPALNWGMITRYGGVVAALKHLRGANDIVPFSKDPKEILFQLKILDDSMVSPSDPVKAFSPGTDLLLDAKAEVKPGDFVIAVVYGEPVELFRQLSLLEKRPDGSMVYALVPLNPFYDTKTIITGKTGDIVARLKSHTREH